MFHLVAKHAKVNMSTRVNRELPFLRQYLYSNKKYRNKLIESATPEQIRCLCECTLNVLNCCLPVSLLKKKHLCSHKHLVRKIALSKLPVETKQKLFLQKGGGIILPLIISAALTLLRSGL